MPERTIHRAPIVLRAYRGPEDHPAMNHVANAVRAFNGDPDISSVADFDNTYAHFDHADLPRDCAIVEIDGRPVGYGRASWQEMSTGGRRVEAVLFVVPEAHGRGVEERLLDHALRRAETLIGEIGSEHATEMMVFIGGRDHELIGLVERLGLVRARRDAELVRPTFDDIPDLPIPAPLVVRPIDPGDRSMHRRVFEADVRAFANSYGQAARSEAQWEAFVGFPSFSPELWQVAFDGDVIAGQILNYLGDADAEGSRIGWTESISVQAEYRRRGLARALLAASLRVVRDAGANSAALGVDTQNPNQALTLYESLGFRVVSESFEYQLGPFPPGSKSTPADRERPMSQANGHLPADSAVDAAPELRAYGWDDGFAASFVDLVDAGPSSEDAEPGRIIVEERGRYLVWTPRGEILAAVSGRFRFDAPEDAAFPAVGDWVALERTEGTSIIRSVLPRRTALVRRPPADHGAQLQVLAANVDTVFVMTSLDHDLNLRRLERYLAAVWESGARPVIVLSKADVAADLDGPRVAVGSVASGVDVVIASALRGTGMDGISAQLVDGKTVAVIGSSGVGKSTLINALLGEDRLDTGGVREDDSRGRHTTTRRHLIRLSTGLIVDTPGMRELALADDTGVSQAFDDIEDLAATCRFSDCGHDGEPGCAVQDAIADGSLASARLDAHRKLAREGARAAREHDALAKIAEKRKWKAIHKRVSVHMRTKYGDDR